VRKFSKKHISSIFAKSYQNIREKTIRLELANNLLVNFPKIRVLGFQITNFQSHKLPNGQIEGKTRLEVLNQSKATKIKKLVF